MAGLVAWQAGDVALFYPDQPRYPAGHPQGGQWMSKGGTGGGKGQPMYEIEGIGGGTDAINDFGPPYRDIDAEGYVDLNNSFDEWKGDLSADEREALESYKYQDYATINELRRNPDAEAYEFTGEGIFEDGSQYMDPEMMEANRLRGDRIEEALDRAPLVNEGMVVYRTTSARHYEDLDVGDTFVDAGFGSATTSQETAMRNDFVEANSAVLGIRVPPGSGRIAPIEDFAPDPSVTGKAWQSEEEILIGNGARFRVLNVVDMQHPLYSKVITLELEGYE